MAELEDLIEKSKKTSAEADEEMQELQERAESCNKRAETESIELLGLISKKEVERD